MSACDTPQDKCEDKLQSIHDDVLIIKVNTKWMWSATVGLAIWMVAIMGYIRLMHPPADPVKPAVDQCIHEVVEK